MSAIVIEDPISRWPKPIGIGMTFPEKRLWIY